MKQLQPKQLAISLRNGLQGNNFLATKNIVRELCPGGTTDFATIIKEGTRVAMYVTAEGAANTAALIYKMIEYANNMLNVYKPMTQPQMMDLAEEFMLELQWVTMEDLAVFFLGIPKQFWGHINNRFDAPVIWDLWDVYAMKRNDFLFDRETSHKGGEEKAVVKRPGAPEIRPVNVGKIMEAKDQWKKDFKKLK